MKRLLIGLVTILAIAPVCWADEDKSDPPAKGEVRIQDLPKPVQELLQTAPRRGS